VRETFTGFKEYDLCNAADYCPISAIDLPGRSANLFSNKKKKCDEIPQPASSQFPPSGRRQAQLLDREALYISHGTKLQTHATPQKGDLQENNNEN
jgi:hypothetical protein